MLEKSLNTLFLSPFFSSSLSRFLPPQDLLIFHSVLRSLYIFVFPFCYFSLFSYVFLVSVFLRLLLRLFPGNSPHQLPHDRYCTWSLVGLTSFETNSSSSFPPTKSHYLPLPLSIFFLCCFSNLPRGKGTRNGAQSYLSHGCTKFFVSLQYKPSETSNIYRLFFQIFHGGFFIVFESLKHLIVHRIRAFNFLVYTPEKMMKPKQKIQNLRIKSFSKSCISFTHAINWSFD